MNYILVSPGFPRGYAQFAVRLREAQVNVLGLGQDHYEDLCPELKAALTEYYRVDNMENYDEMLRAVGYFTHKYGRIHRLESHNEHWLIQDARLRTDFNIPGLKSQDMADVKFKSRMKQIFRSCGVPVARGEVVFSEEEAAAVAADYGYPVVIKPDMGVGAQDTHRLDDAAALQAFFQGRPPRQWILEEFIEGTIVSFDGLTDQNGELVFTSSFTYSSGVMDIVNNGLDVYYHTEREIPPDLVRLGEAAVRAFGLKERFFHLEFFRRPSGGLVALEINVRPPGGYSIDMWNYAGDVDRYRQYAQVVTGTWQDETAPPLYYCCFASRRNASVYSASLSEILARCGTEMQFHGDMPRILAAAMGDYAFLFRVRTRQELAARNHLILDHRP